jgi:RND family efflux transporter MFP subunit
MTWTAVRRGPGLRLLFAVLAAAGLAAGCGRPEADRPGAPATSKAGPAHSASPPGGAPAAGQPVTVRTAAVEERAVSGALNVVGTLTADSQTDVAAEVGGRVVEVPIERGSAVRAGQLLARLDDEDAKSQLREAEANEAQTRVRLGLSPGKPFDARETPEARMARLSMERAESEWKRYDGLIGPGAVSQSDLDLKRTEYLNAKESYESTLNQQRQLFEGYRAQQARVAMARRAVANAVIRAPYDGVIAERAVSLGALVQPGTRVATLIRVHPLRIELAIPEAAVPVVRKGQTVLFTTQAQPDEQFTGTVAYVGPAVRAESRALVVEAVVPNPKGLLHPGVFANARIELPGSRPALMVPATAVKTDETGSRVYVVRDGRAEARVVLPGRAAGDAVELVSGVKAGERVVVEGADRLADGARVRE